MNMILITLSTFLAVVIIQTHMQGNALGTGRQTNHKALKGRAKIASRNPAKSMWQSVAGPQMPFPWFSINKSLATDLGSKMSICPNMLSTRNFETPRLPRSPLGRNANHPPRLKKSDSPWQVMTGFGRR